MDTKLIDMYKKYSKKNKLYEFTKYLNDNNLKDNFLQQLFNSSFMKRYEGKEYNEAMELSNYAIALSRKTLEEKFGENLAKKMIESIYKLDEPFSRNHKIMALAVGDEIKGVPDETSRENLEQLLDLTSNPDNVYGIHIVGGQNGEGYMQFGYPITGNQLVANDYDLNNDYEFYKNLELNISKNTYLFRNDQIGLILKLIANRGYKAKPDGKYNDVMLVSIPKDELDNNNPDIIVDIGGHKFLSPEYIKGFVRTDIGNGSINQICTNPYFSEKFSIPQSYNEWNTQFENWYKTAGSIEFQPYKHGMIETIQEILARKKSKDILEKQENPPINTDKNENIR